MSGKEQKIFLVINLSYFGDVLVTNELCQNIKLNYPDSKIVFLVNTPFYEAAKYQYGVDEVLTFDKRNKNKGLLGLLKFVFSCKYRNKIYASFIIYSNDRAALISYFLNCKRRISGSGHKLKFLLTDVSLGNDNYRTMQNCNTLFVSEITKKPIQPLPIKYLTNVTDDSLPKQIAQQFKNKEIIGLCTVGKQKENYLPIEIAIELIEKLNKEGKTVFYFGAGNDSKNYATELKKRGCLNFVDLVDATTISQLANIMKLCKAVISIDTGTMHLSYATETPTVCIFNRAHMVGSWAPDKKLYPHTKVVEKGYSAESIYAETMNLIKEISSKN